MVYSQGKTKEIQDIINQEDYKLSVKKTWIESAQVWHIQFLSQSQELHRWELFLNKEQVKTLKEIL